MEQIIFANFDRDMQQMKWELKVRGDMSKEHIIYSLIILILFNHRWYSC